jgi:hypothetical protein
LKQDARLETSAPTTGLISHFAGFSSQLLHFLAFLLTFAIHRYRLSLPFETQCSWPTGFFNRPRGAFVAQSLAQGKVQRITKQTNVKMSLMCFILLCDCKHR